MPFYFVDVTIRDGDPRRFPTNSRRIKIEEKISSDEFKNLICRLYLNTVNSLVFTKKKKNYIKMIPKIEKDIDRFDFDDEEFYEFETTIKQSEPIIIVCISFGVKKNRYEADKYEYTHMELLHTKSPKNKDIVKGKEMKIIISRKDMKFDPILLKKISKKEIEALLEKEKGEISDNEKSESEDEKKSKKSEKKTSKKSESEEEEKVKSKKKTSKKSESEESEEEEKVKSKKKTSKKSESEDSDEN